MEVARRCSNLQTLYLGYCWNITDASVMEVARGCPNLKSLNLNGCRNITSVCRAFLQDKKYNPLYRYKSSSLVATHTKLLSRNFFRPPNFFEQFQKLVAFLLPIFGNVDGSWRVTSKLRGFTLIQVARRRSKVFQRFSASLVRVVCIEQKFNTFKVFKIKRTEICTI